MPDGDVRPPAADTLGGLIKLAVDLRLVLLLIAMATALLQGADRRVLVLMLLASYAGAGVLLWWDRLAAALLRQPWLFLVDVAVTVCILVVTGVDGPFVLYTISTAFLAGALYATSGGVVFGVGIAVAYLVVAQGLPAPERSFASLVGIPVLIVVAGIGAATMRRLLLHAAKVEAELEVAVAQAAASDERARLAREMHDTLGKTLHGISLSAATLPAWVDRRPEQAAARAAEVAAAAETAAVEARQLISDLRSDTAHSELHVAIGDWATSWAAETQISCTLALSPVDPMSASTRYELFTILREALRNVAAHSGAGRASVYLALDDGWVVLEVADDGCGLTTTDLERLAADGHYGLVGMRERAERAGGALVLRDRRPGTTIRAEVPRTSAHDMVRPPAEVEPR